MVVHVIAFLSHYITTQDLGPHVRLIVRVFKK